MLAHSSIGQIRKYTNEPYIVHPREVVEILRTMTATPPSNTMLAAAWLHDVVEDTPFTLADIRMYFNDRVARLVEQLTDISKPRDGNRRTRKAIDRAHTAIASPEAKTIKLADLISNTRSIVEEDLKFAEIYLQEKLLLLDVLKEGDDDLWVYASRIAHHGLLQLEELAVAA